MEVKINKDIREFTESIFFGLSMRQFIFSLLACIVAVILYFFLRPFFGLETLSWVCILGAVPFAVLGFVKYNGMTAEQFIMAWIRSTFLIPSHLVFRANNIYRSVFDNLITRNLKRDFIKNKRQPKPKKDKEKKDKKNKKNKKKRNEEVDEINENSK